MASGRIINSLQVGRGLAAMAVLVHHAVQQSVNLGQRVPAADLLMLGYLGVDFFFVLSGFIICHAVLGRKTTAMQFAKARFRRVYLPYFPIGIAIAALLLFVPTAHQWDWLATLTLVPIGEPALTVAWTLQHEITFYLIFGLFYYAGLLPLGLAVWLVAIAIGPDIIPFRAINLEFFFGVAACLAVRYGRAPKALMLAVLPLVGLASYFENRVIFGLAIAFLIAPLAAIELRRTVHFPKSLILLGAASYSIYLVHYPVIAALGRAGMASAILLGLVALAAGLAYHFAVELRVVNLRRNPEVAAPQARSSR